MQDTNHIVQVLSPAPLYNQHCNENWYFFLPPTFSPNFVSNADGQVRYQLSRKSPILDFGEPVHQPFNSCSLFCLKQTRSAYWLALRGPIGRTTIPGSFAGLKCGGSQRPSCHSRSSLRHRLRIVGKITFPHPMQYLFCRYTVSVSRTISLVPLKIPNSLFFQVT